MGLGALQTDRGRGLEGRKALCSDTVLHMVFILSVRMGVPRICQAWEGDCLQLRSYFYQP